MLLCKSVSFTISKWWLYLTYFDSTRIEQFVVIRFETPKVAVTAKSSSGAVPSPSVSPSKEGHLLLWSTVLIDLD